jgi:NodT family efflux transporter outer membrane factor (OMF) lipoprotein
MAFPLTLALAFVITASAASSDSWWTAYNDPELNRLVTQAQANNLDIRKAGQRLAEARALTGESRSKLLPTLNFNAGAQQLRGGFQQGVVRIPQGGVSGASFVSPFETSILQGGLDSRWELDFWGTNRAAVSAAQADVVAETELLRDVSITVSAEVARAYIEMRGFEERISIVTRSRDAQRELFDLTQTRAEAGLATQLDVERQATLLANTEASLDPLEAERIARVNRLAVLLGDRAVIEKIFAAATQARLEAPPLAAGISSELLRRRPDVRAAEARITAALARFKQARTDLYPKVVLTGSLGRQATTIGGLSLGGGNFFGIGPQLQLPIFTGGRIRSNIAVNDARAGQAKTTFEQELLAAFEEAENAIAAYRLQTRRAASLEASAAAASRSLDLAQDLHRAGLETFLTVLDAQRTLLDAQYQLAESRTATLAQSVLLYKALAGGWPQ